MNYTLTTALISFAGLAFHFLLSWGAHYRDPLTPRMGALDYILLDFPGWLASFIGCVAMYFMLPELAAAMGASVVIGVTPLWSFVAGYFGSSVLGKVLAIIGARIGLR